MNEKLLREWIYEALVEEVPLKNMADYIYKQHTYSYNRPSSRWRPGNTPPGHASRF